MMNASIDNDSNVKKEAPYVVINREYLDTDAPFI